MATQDVLATLNEIRDDKSLNHRERQKKLEKFLGQLIRNNPGNRDVDTSFIVELNLKTHSSHSSFPAAICTLLDEANKALDRGATLLWLETGVSISHTVLTPQGPVKCKLGFHQAMSLAHEIGIIDKGFFKDPDHPIFPILIETAFLSGEGKNRAAEDDEQLEFEKFMAQRDTEAD